MDRKSVIYPTGVCPTNRPHVVRSAGRYAVEEAMEQVATVGAGDNAPLRTVPVLYQRMIYDERAKILSYRPYIVGGKGRDALKPVFFGGWADVGAWHDIPPAAVPVFDQSVL